MTSNANAIGLPAILLLVVCASGATCLPKRAISEFQPPVVFQNTPDIQQIAEVLNRSRGVQQLQSNAVTVRANGYTLSASLVWERERRFRMKGGVMSMLGDQFDVGSNDDVFWMADKTKSPPTLYFARHDQFENQLNRQVLPVSPLWLLEAIGIVELDPYTVSRPPQIRPDGMMEVDSVVPSPIGAYTRKLIIDPKRGFTTQVAMFDPSGRLIASALQRDHDMQSGIIPLPKKVKVQLIPYSGQAAEQPLVLELDIKYYSINANEGNDASRFMLPNEREYQRVDLVQWNQNPYSAITPIAYQSQRRTLPQISYRGADPRSQRR